jgi:hypothetical protein
VEVQTEILTEDVHNFEGVDSLQRFCRERRIYSIQPLLANHLLPQNVGIDNNLNLMVEPFIA